MKEFYMWGWNEDLKSYSIDIKKVFTPWFKATLTLILENASPRRRTSPSARVPIVHLTWDRRKSWFPTAGALFERKIDLLLCKDSFSTAQMIIKFISIILIAHFIQYREIIFIYCKILKDTCIDCVNKILLHVNSYWLVIYLFV